jgi:hypothetical protein
MEVIHHHLRSSTKVGVIYLLQKDICAERNWVVRRERRSITSAIATADALPVRSSNRLVDGKSVEPVAVLADDLREPPPMEVRVCAHKHRR